MMFGGEGSVSSEQLHVSRSKGQCSAATSNNCLLYPPQPTPTTRTTRKAIGFREFCSGFRVLAPSRQPRLNSVGFVVFESMSYLAHRLAILASGLSRVSSYPGTPCVYMQAQYKSLPNLLTCSATMNSATKFGVCSQLFMLCLRRTGNPAYSSTNCFAKAPHKNAAERKPSTEQQATNTQSKCTTPKPLGSESRACRCRERQHDLSSSSALGLVDSRLKLLKELKISWRLLHWHIKAGCLEAMQVGAGVCLRAVYRVA